MNSFIPLSKLLTVYGDSNSQSVSIFLDVAKELIFKEDINEVFMINSFNSKQQTSVIELLYEKSYYLKDKTSDLLFLFENGLNPIPKNKKLTNIKTDELLKLVLSCVLDDKNNLSLIENYEFLKYVIDNNFIKSIEYIKTKYPNYDFNKFDNKYGSPLWNVKSVEMVELLDLYRANFFGKDEKGKTILDYIVLNKDLNNVHSLLLKKLKKLKVNKDEVQEHLINSFNVFLRQKKSKSFLLKELNKIKIDLNNFDFKGDGFLQNALIYKNYKIVPFLLERMNAKKYVGVQSSTFFQDFFSFFTGESEDAIQIIESLKKQDALFLNNSNKTFSSLFFESVLVNKTSKIGSVRSLIKGCFENYKVAENIYPEKYISEEDLNSVNFNENSRNLFVQSALQDFCFYLKADKNNQGVSEEVFSRLINVVSLNSMLRDVNLMIADFLLSQPKDVIGDLKDNIPIVLNFLLEDFIFRKDFDSNVMNFKYETLNKSLEFLYKYSEVLISDVNFENVKKALSLGLDCDNGKLKFVYKLQNEFFSFNMKDINNKRKIKM